MDVLEFVASLVASVLSWPVLVGVIVLVFLKPLRELIGRVKTLETGGSKATFGDRIDAVERSTEFALEDIVLPTAAEPSLAPQSSAEHGLDSAASMFQAWEELGTALQGLYDAAGLTGELTATRGRGRRRSPVLMADELYKNGQVNEAFVRSVRELQGLRNEVAHGRHDPTSGEAAAYIETATELTRAARYFAEHLASTKR